MSEKITKPCRVGGVTFQIGVSVDTVISASQRLYERQLNNPENPQVEMKELRKLIMGTHVLVPKEPTLEMLKVADKHVMDCHATPESAYKVMIEAVEKDS